MEMYLCRTGENWQKLSVRVELWIETKQILTKIDGKWQNLGGNWVETEDTLVKTCPKMAGTDGK